MPNVHGQVTREDFKAPAGKFRIMREEMSDGQLTIVADFIHHEFAVLGMEMVRATHPEDVFTLCDENGVVEEGGRERLTKEDLRALRMHEK